MKTLTDDERNSLRRTLQRFAEQGTLVQHGVDGDIVLSILEELEQYRAMFNRETLGDLMISEATGGNGPRHIFNEEGTCIRCGEDAEEWDAGCVEELLTLAAIDGVKAEQYHTAARKVAAYVHTLRRQLRDLYQLASGGIVSDNELNAIDGIVRDFIEAEQEYTFSE